MFRTGIIKHSTHPTCCIIAGWLSLSFRKGKPRLQGEMAQAWTADLKFNHLPNKTTLAYLLSWFKSHLSAYSLCILSMNFYTTFTSFGLFKLNHSKLLIFTAPAQRDFSPCPDITQQESYICSQTPLKEKRHTQPLLI